MKIYNRPQIVILDTNQSEDFIQTSPQLEQKSYTPTSDDNSNQFSKIVDFHSDDNEDW